MPSDHSPEALFLFAHQDDEFGVFAQIEIELANGRRVYCVYVTDGGATAEPGRRDGESRTVLKSIGMDPRDVLFLGSSLSINDGKLHLSLNPFTDWLKTFLDAHPGIEAVYLPAWEGGHPDHDLLHAATARLLAERGHLSKARQFPLYNAAGMLGPFFAVLSPLKENGPIQRAHIRWVDRLRHVRLCLSYPSQWRTWLGLFPFVCWTYLVDGSQKLQPVSLERLAQRPHHGRLYYEQRGFLDWPTVRRTLDGEDLARCSDK